MKRKTNISLVGGQPMPIYMGIEATQCDRLVLIHSAGEHGSLPEAEIIKRNTDRPTTLFPMVPTDYNKIIIEVEALLNAFKDDEIWVNISSGTKPWTVAFTMAAVGKENVTLFYVDQNNVFYNINKREKRQLSPNLNIESVLKYHNQRGFTYTSLSEYTSEDEKVLKKIIELRKCNIRDFNKLTIASNDSNWKNKLENAKEGSLSLTSGSYIRFDKLRKNVEFYLQCKYFSKKALLHSEHVTNIALNSGWLEFYVAKMLQKWNQANEIWLNVKFPYISGNAKNEIDVIANIGGKLLFVECKTQIFNNTDIDKFSTAVRNYGGMGAKALFVTHTEMRSEAKQKCTDNRIMAFSLKNDLKNEQHAQALFDLLNREIKNINKK